MTEDDTFDALKKTDFFVVFDVIQATKRSWNTEQQRDYLAANGWTLNEYDMTVQEVWYPPIEGDVW